MTSGITTDISSGITTRLDREFADVIPNLKGPVGLAGWKSEKLIWIYDNYDIWEVDLSGRTAPVNITNGYGRLHHIKFHLIDDHGAESIFHEKSLLLTAFNTNNKENGFYRQIMTRNANPGKLVMDSAIFYQFPNSPEWDKSGMAPVKAHNSDTWVVMRQSFKEAPNYWITHDFQTFKAISGFRPEGKYNWLTAQLIRWKQLDGTFSEGILYKPENFDPQKEVPDDFQLL